MYLSLLILVFLEFLSARYKEWRKRVERKELSIIF